ncbi:ADP-ribosylglycohydrolase family protein [Catenibacterium mitsuokai]|uniref:ADP-ribosylglycohydrolase family protein n=1 Tax=Catenibacterium TaxID=135858 RepID=UPI001C23C257|nr:ADP-ribosylglycohydrolase family protein [Catenibacterium mitsuokai]MBU9056137.1 ADP-ribosylglycohydrolase family protein [Catenibacterium mitsuokai]MCB5426834.1 ADP-ribosylglycohydrolase family protein [Catenibacterium mitsuokai]
MYGAILGDIIGSPFEFDRGDKTKDFKLFSRRSHFTDDSVMTLAVCEALLKVGQDATVKEIEDAVISSMQSWGRKYPHEGYGGYFRCWLTARHPEPYNSFGNGSAMRVSAAGWLYDSLEKTRVVAKATANVTHNHLEGIKGAEATASAIFMARNGSSKEEIKKYIENEFHYDLNRTLDEIRPSFHMDETCQKTVPEAIIAFLEARDFEDAIRNAVSLGGDTDTLGAITGSIAEAYFGISETLISECRNRINKDMRDVVDAFYSLVRKDDSPNTNQMIEKAIKQYYVHNDKEGMILFMNTLLNAMKQGGEFIVPYITKNSFLSKEQINSINIDDTFTLDHDVKLKMETVKDASGKEWLGVFTSSNEMHKGSSGNVQINQSILSILRLALDLEEINGIVINPFGKYMQVSKAMILLLISIYEEHEK